MRLTVAADDRTGALETAAALADRGAGSGAGVPVTVWPELPDGSVGVAVVDLGSRHLDPSEAAARAGELATEPASAHKIDSTLRGNWASELAARLGAGDLRMLLVPAFPELGRTCVNGLVSANGVPVAELHDVRSRPFSSRPAKHLAALGVASHPLPSLVEVERWIETGSGVAVADAVTSDDIDDIVSSWARAPEVLLAGTSEVIARAHSALTGSPTDARLKQRLERPVLVVLGSVNSVARRQVEVALTERVPDWTLLETSLPDQPVTGERAAAAAGDLAAEVDRHLARQAFATIVVIGGDTAAALLGPAAVRVYGSVAPGTAWIESPRFRQPVISRAGGFGGQRALVDLLSGTLPS